MNAKAIVKAREKTHGHYNDYADLVQRLKSEMSDSNNWDILTPAQRESCEMIASKLGRLLSGDQNHKDHWDDIAGYAELISRTLPPR